MIVCGTNRIGSTVLSDRCNQTAKTRKAEPEEQHGHANSQSNANIATGSIP